MRRFAGRSTTGIFRAAYAAALAASIVVAAVAPAHAADAEGAPRLALSAPSVAPGDSLIVTGEGFPANTSAQVVLCGNLALAGSADCDMPHARVAGTNEKGHFATEMAVALPPSPCPCVIQASSLALSSAVTTPVEVVGAPKTQPQGVVPAQPTALKAKASLEGSGPTAAWFGGQPHRTLVLDVTNPGTTPVSSPVVQLTVGRGDNPTTATQAPDLGVIAPGETKTYKIPVELDAFAVGNYTVRGVIKGDGEPVTFRAKTGAFPWGLVAVVLLVVQLVLLAVRDRMRRKLLAAEAAERRAQAPTGGLAPGVGDFATYHPVRVGVVPRAAATAALVVHRRPRQPVKPLPPREPLTTPAAVSELRALATTFVESTSAVSAADPQIERTPVEGPFLLASENELIGLGHEPMQHLERIDPLAYWASPLLTVRASKRAHLRPVDDAQQAS